MITVRRGRIDDTEQVQALLSRVWPDDYVPHVWAEWVQQPEWGIVLVAEYRDSIVGTCYVDFMANGTCWFQAMRVDPDYRRLGVGSALTQSCFTEAKASGMREAYLGIDSDNTASLQMTARQGFEQILYYQRLMTKLPPRDTLPTSQSLWRQAVEDDIDAILHLCKLNDITSIFACWQWEPLSQDALLRNIRQESLWVYGKGEITAWAGFEIHKPEYHLFAPCGSASHVQAAIDDLLSFIQGTNEAELEVWMSAKDSLRDYLSSLGFHESDGYTIWRYTL